MIARAKTNKGQHTILTMCLVDSYSRTSNGFVSKDVGLQEEGLEGRSEGACLIKG